MDNPRSLHDLRRYWDDLVRGKPASPEGLDPDTAALLQRLQTLPTTRPDAAYVADLRETLMHSATIPLPLTAPPPPNGHRAPVSPALPGGPVRLPAPHARRDWPLAQAAIILLIIAAMIAVCFAALRPQPEPTFAPSVATPAAGVSNEWPMYKADPARSNTSRGPGPEGNPIAVWTYHAGGSAARSPAIADSVVYLQTGDGVVTALDALTGAVLWSNATTGTSVQTPAVAGDTVYLTTIKGELVALNTATGAEQWRFGSSLAIDSAPVVQDGVVYVGSDDSTVYAIDGATGKPNWQATIGGPLWRSLTIGGGLLFAGSSTGTVDALDLASGEARWQFTGDDPSQSVGTPFFTNGTVYMSNAGVMHALDAATGTELWRREFPGARPATYAGNLLISTSADGGVYATDATTGAEGWTIDTGEDINAAPIVVAGVVYVATQEGSLRALDAATGGERWTFPLDGAVEWGPSATDGMIFAGTDAGTLYAIGGDGSQQLAAPLVATPAPAAASATNGVVAGEGPAIGSVSYLGELGDPANPIDATGGVAQAADGTIYVADVNHNQIQRFDRDGNPLSAWGGPDDPAHDFELGNAELGFGDIRIGADGSIYILEMAGARVQKLAPDGTVLATWGEPGNGEGQFFNPTTLNIAPDGSIMVVDPGNHRIQVFDQDGNFLRAWGKSGDAPGSLVWPWSVAVRPNGTYLVTDVGHQVFAYDQDGNYLGTVFAGEGPSTDKESSGDIKVDAEGYIYLGDYRNNRMTVLAPDFTPLASWGQKGSGAGEFDGVGGFGLGQDGRVLISDEGNGRVLVFQFTPDGAPSATPTP
ncbi:MAG: PQQ-binding-like beta-propeller repeat protein [Thermomicrobiales bacterium]